MVLHPEGIVLKNKTILFILVFSYLLVIVPFTAYLKNRPVAVKLGYVPDGEILKVVSADHRFTLAEFAVVKVLIYFGSLLPSPDSKMIEKPEYFNMFKTLENALRLDPYNLDAYYFTQAAFTWEVGRIRDVNNVLQYGMRYRTWDYMLPFYVAFNDAYFLKDYKNAAIFMKRSAEISKNPLFTNLAARFFYESRQSEFGIMFLNVMEQGAKDKNIKQMYAVRRSALLAVKELTEAVERYRKRFGKEPRDLHEVVTSGVIARIPGDPYGGTFYLADDGMIRSTSKFAFRSQQK